MATRWQRKVTVKALKANTVPGFDCSYDDGEWVMVRLSDLYCFAEKTEKEAVQQLKYNDVNRRD
jgi:hypothetical protein